MNTTGSSYGKSARDHDQKSAEDDLPRRTAGHRGVGDESSSWHISESDDSLHEFISDIDDEVDEEDQKGRRKEPSSYDN